MLNNRKDGLCCGGGGGRIWAETKKNERFSDIRVRQAIDAGADTIATACLTAWLTSRIVLLSMDKSSGLQVKKS